MNRTFVILGGFLGALAVAFGAFGTHMLEGNVSAEYLKTWDTATEYQLAHAVALMGSGLLRNFTRSAMLRWASWLLFIGTVLFSGSLYLLVLGDTPRLGAITPIGGVCLIAGWLLMSMSLIKFDTDPKGYHDVKKKHRHRQSEEE